MTSRPISCTVFQGSRRLATAPPLEAALVFKAAVEREPEHPVIVFDDATGEPVDFDLRGGPQDVARRFDERFGPMVHSSAEDAPRRGRPRLGVVPREVTLLPRHWSWLSVQPGGASVALRKLVEEARRADEGPAQIRAAQQSAYRFMSTMAGDAVGFEEATRALFAQDRSRFEGQIATWPTDVRDHLSALAAPAFA